MRKCLHRLTCCESLWELPNWISLFGPQIKNGVLRPNSITLSDDAAWGSTMCDKSLLPTCITIKAGWMFITEGSAFHRSATKLMPCAAVYRPRTPWASSALMAAICGRDSEMSLPWGFPDSGVIRKSPCSTNEWVSNKQYVWVINGTYSGQFGENIEETLWLTWPRWQIFVFLMSRGYVVRHVTDSLASIGCQYYLIPETPE